MSTLSNFKSSISKIVEALKLKEAAKKAAVSSIPVIGPTISAASTVSKLMQPKQQPQVFKVGEFSPEAKAIDKTLTGSPSNIKVPSYQEQVAGGQIQTKQVGLPKIPQPPMTQQQTQQAQQMFQPTGADIAQQTVDKVISQAQPYEKPVSIKVPFLPFSVKTEAAPTSAKRFLAEMLKGIVEVPEKVANTIGDFQNAMGELIQKGSIDAAYNQIKPFDPEEETKVSSYAQDYKNLINQDSYLSKHPIQAFSLIASQGILDIAFIGSVIQRAIRNQIAKLPAELAEVTDAKLKLGIDLDKPLTDAELKTAYNKVAKITHPDVGGSAAKFQEATDARNLLAEKLKGGPLPAVSQLNQSYGNILKKIDGDIRDWFKTPEKKAYLGVKGLLPEKAGMKPVQPLQKQYQPAVGMSTREVKEVPIKPPKSPTQKVVAEGKTVEGFISDNFQRVFRGGKGFDAKKVSNEGVSVTYDKGVAKGFGEAEELFIPDTAKIMQWEQIPNKEKLFRNLPGKGLMPIESKLGGFDIELGKIVKSEGYDGVDLRELGFGFEKEYRIYNPGILKTRSQLTKAVEKARGAPKPPETIKSTPAQSIVPKIPVKKVIPTVPVKKIEESLVREIKEAQAENKTLEEFISKSKVLKEMAVEEKGIFGKNEILHQEMLKDVENYIIKNPILEGELVNAHKLNDWIVDTKLREILRDALNTQITIAKNLGEHTYGLVGKKPDGAFQIQLRQNLEPNLLKRTIVEEALHVLRMKKGRTNAEAEALLEYFERPTEKFAKRGVVNLLGESFFGLPVKKIPYSKQEIADIWNEEQKKKFVLPTKKARIPTIKQRISVVTEGKIPEVKINTTEKSLLLKKLTDIKSGASVAKKVEQKVAARQVVAEKRQTVRVEKRTRRETRTKIIEAITSKLKSVEEVKSQITEYAKTNLPLNERGKLLDMVRNSETKGDLAKSMLKIDAMTRFVKAKEIRETIKDLGSNIDNLPIDVKKKINEFLSQFSFSRMKDETIQRLLKSREYLESEYNLPNRIKMRIQMLTKTPLQDLSINNLENIKTKLDGLINEGKIKARVKQEIEDLRYDATLKKLKEGSKNLDIETKKRMPGRPSGEGWLDEKKSATAQLVQKGDFALTFMDRFFDMLDGNKHYQGVNYKTFYDPIKHANDLYLTESTNLSNKMFDLQKKLNLNVYDYEKIGMYAVLQQTNGVEKLLANGYSQKMIDSIHLNDRQLRMYNFMRNTFDELHPRLNKIMEEQYNESLGFVENYFPFQTDFEEMTPTLDQVKKMYRRTTTEKGFTKQRTLAKTPVKIDAGFIYKNYVENAIHFIHMNDTISKLGKIANNPEYGEMVGEKAQKVVQQWLDVLARKGGVTDRIRIQLLNTLRANLGVSMLGFKISSALYQPLAKFNGAAEIGKWAFKYDIDFINKPEIRKFVIQASPELRTRIGDDPGYVELSENPTWKNIQQKSLWVLQRLDSLTAGSVWYGAYRKRLFELGLQFDLTKVNPEALDYADRVVRITQASPLYKDLPPAFVNKYRDLNKTLFTFQTFMLNDWNYIKHDLVKLGITDAKEIALIDNPQTKSKEKAKLINRISNQLLWLIVAMVGQEALQSGLSYMYYGKDYDTVKSHLISGLMSRIPGLSQVYSAFAYEQIPAPLASVVQNFIKSGKQLYTTKTLKSKITAGIKVLETIGQVSGVPGSSEISKILRGSLPRLFKALKGKPENPYK